MPHFETIALSGTIQHVFAHRFTLDADGQVYLADLTPKGAVAFPIEPGLPVTLEGETRPSEIKVTRITAAGREAVAIEHKKPNHAPGHARAHGPADLDRLLAAVRGAGWQPEGDIRRKPKHVELLARREGAGPTELHVDFAGTIYKQKAADMAKWATTA